MNRRERRKVEEEEKKEAVPDISPSSFRDSKYKVHVCYTWGKKLIVSVKAVLKYSVQ